MHSYRKDIALFLLLLIAVFITVAAGPLIAHLTEIRLRHQLGDVWEEVMAMAGFVRVAAPRLAVVLTDGLIVSGALMVLYCLGLIVVLPWGMLSLHRRIDALHSERYALRLQLATAGAADKPLKSVSIPGPFEEVRLNPASPEPVSELRGKMKTYDQ
jgi:hypothetical protein